MEFGERLKQLRIEKGFTQEDVANALCVTKQAVSKWENSASLPDVAYLGALADLMGVDIDYLLTGNDNVKIEKQIEIVEKEKIVEVEKEIIKEKTVEVEKPLSKEDKERMLYIYNCRKNAVYFGYVLIAISAIFIIIFGALKSYAAIAGAFGVVVSVPFTIIARHLYKSEYEKVKKCLDEPSENNKNKNENK